MNLFIGEFPSPFNGVSVKNRLIYQEIYSKNNVKIIDLAECKRHPVKIPLVGIQIVIKLLMADHVVIGVGTSKRLKILLRIRRILRGKKAMQGLSILAMGGRLHLILKEDVCLKQLLSEVGCILVETNGIAEGLKEQGLRQIKVVPNCRSSKGGIPPQNAGEQVKFVFFSVVCAEKGMDSIKEAIAELDCNYTLDIYGEIVDRYRDTFEAFLKKNPEVHYRGVFDSINGNTYEELNKYDVMLFPSQWAGEGVSGTLVESKMAGITAIVSDWNFNREIVIDGVEGIVQNGKLSTAMKELVMDKDRLNKLKWGAYESRKRFDIETYENELLELVIGGKNENSN